MKKDVEEEKMVCATCGNLACASAQETIGIHIHGHTCAGWEPDTSYFFADDADPGAPRTAQAKKLREVARA